MTQQLTSNSTVALEKCTSYNACEVYDSLLKCISHINGLSHYFKAGYRVLLKPNLLSSSPPSACITTHPQIVKTLCQMLIELGAKVQIGDSPGIGTTTRNAAETGMQAIADELGVELVDFTESVTIVTPSGFPLKIAKPVQEADIVINLPKLKTHVQLYMTIGVKNCFGCIVGSEKAQWHYRAGLNEKMFANMLVQTCIVVKPQLTILDAIMSMEGDGPAGGTPRHTGFIAASNDPFALDRVVLEILGLNPDRMLVLQEAEKCQAGCTRLEQITIAGSSISKLRIENFIAPARLQPLNFNRVPWFLRGFLRECFTSKPKLVSKLCIHCRRCEKACPANAIEFSHNKTPVFKYEKCICCFCCHEMCPNKAIAVKDGCGLKILNPLRKMFPHKFGI